MTERQAIDILCKLPQVRAEAKRNRMGVTNYVIQAPAHIIEDVVAGKPVELVAPTPEVRRKERQYDKLQAYWNSLKARKKLSKTQQADVEHNAVRIAAEAKRKEMATKVEQNRVRKQEEERRYAELAGSLLLSKEEQRERMNREQ